MSGPLYEDAMEFLALRKLALTPNTFAANQNCLLSFDRHLENRGKTEKSVTEEDVRTWIQPMYGQSSVRTISSKISFLRIFLAYLREKEIPVYMPPSLKVPATYMPYLFSDSELQSLFSAADNFSLQKATHCPVQRMEFPMLIRMLYSCGFRLGELLSVRTADIDFANGVIFIRNGKNKKQRIVPMPDALTEMLRRYCLAMNVMGDSENCVFPSKNPKKPLAYSTVWFWMQTLLKDTGIYVRREAHSRGQCVHCFRHLFAIKSFAQAQQRLGRSVSASIPYLSDYLGHHSVQETERYLRFSPDMFPEHTRLFEEYSEGVFPEVGDEN